MKNHVSLRKTSNRTTQVDVQGEKTVVSDASWATEDGLHVYRSYDRYGNPQYWLLHGLFYYSEHDKLAHVRAAIECQRRRLRR